MNLLSKVINSIINQVDLIWIGDNSPIPIVNNISLNTYKNRIEYKYMNGNIGIAAAQNKGIKYAIEHEYEFSFFLDQDSICSNNIISDLVEKYNNIESSNIKIGAIGPRVFNRQNNKEYRGLIKKGIKLNKNITEVNELISSASLIKISTFNNIGLMDESLFIDGVDHEWCWRAKYIGKYRFFISENVKLNHQFGEGDHFFILRKIAIPTPFRVYYQFRNYIWLVHKEYVPLYWKLSNGFKYFIKLFYFPIFIPPRIEYLKKSIKGIKDGIFK